MDLQLYLQEEGGLRVLKVPKYVVKDLLRDRLGKWEIDRINRFAEKAELPEFFTTGSVVVDMAKKTARCFQTGINLADLEPTWDVKAEEMTLRNY